MHIEEQPFVRDGLRPGDIVTCDLRVGTVSIIRPKDASYPAGGYRTLRWGSGAASDKRYVSSITDRPGFLDFMMTLAETHGCGIRVDHRSESKLACELIALVV